jgi:hypothetical protein
MDPLILILEEVARLRKDIAEHEEKLVAHESKDNFDSQNSGYLRLRNEKELFLKNIADLRMELCQKGMYGLCNS